MVRKGNLAVFESTNISETREVMPTKIGDMHYTSIPTLMNFLSRFHSIKFLTTMDYNGQKGKFGGF